MPRTLSIAAAAAVHAQETGEAFLVLLTLSHPDLAQPIRVTSDGKDTPSRGSTYLQYPFEVTLPDEGDEAPPSVSLRIDNVDRQIVAAVRGITGDAITVRLEVVLASTPDVVEAGPYDFALREVSYDAQTIEGTLHYEDIIAEPYPGDSFTPSRFPGQF